MEEIAEGIFRSIIVVIRWIVIHLIFHILCFNLGRLILLLFTLGKYPRLHALERDEDKISFFGLLVIVLSWVAIYVNNVYL